MKKQKLIRKILFYLLVLLCGFLFFGLKTYAASDNQNNNDSQADYYYSDGERSIQPGQNYYGSSSIASLIGNVNDININYYFYVSNDMLNITSGSYRLFRAMTTSSTYGFELILTSSGLGANNASGNLVSGSTLLPLSSMSEGDIIFVNNACSNSLRTYGVSFSVYHYKLINGSWTLANTICSGWSPNYAFNYFYYNSSVFSKNIASLSGAFDSNEAFLTNNTILGASYNTIFPNSSGQTWFIYKELLSFWDSSSIQIFTIYGASHNYLFYINTSNETVNLIVDLGQSEEIMSYTNNDIIGIKYTGSAIELLSYSITQPLINEGSQEEEISGNTYFTQNTSTYTIVTGSVEKVEFFNGFMGGFTPSETNTIPNYYLNTILNDINTMQYNYGYQEGIEGETVFTPVWGILSGVFSVVASVMSIELVPHITIGVFFLVPLFFAVLGLILWIWKGKN